MSKDYTNASMSILFLVALKFSQVITLLVPVEVQPRSQGPLSFSFILYRGRKIGLWELGCMVVCDLFNPCFHSFQTEIQSATKFRLQLN